MFQSFAAAGKRKGKGAERVPFFRPGSKNLRVLKAKLFILSLFLLVPFMATEAQTQKGKASFYSPKLAGRSTASGEVFTVDGFTCAHRSYPFGTLLRVKNLDNGREVVVRVNDRGPFVKNRVVDVSYAAAEKLGMIKSGTCNVEVRKVEVASEPLPVDAASLLLTDNAPAELFNPLGSPWSVLAVNDALVNYE